MTDFVVDREPISTAGVSSVVFLEDVRNMIVFGGEYFEAERAGRVTKDFVISALVWFSKGAKGVTFARSSKGSWPVEIVTSSRLAKGSSRDESQDVLYFILGLLMSLGKEITEQNRDSIDKRWKAFTVSMGIVSQVSPTHPAYTLAAIKVLRDALLSRTSLKTAILKKIAETTYTDQETGILGQARMVWEYSGYKAVLFMESFIQTGSMVLEIETILDQAIALKIALREARKDVNFMYSRVMDQNANPELSHKLYNHLYVAAIMYAKQAKVLSDNFKCHLQ